MFLLFLIAAACAQDIVVIVKINAVAAKIGKVPVGLKSAVYHGTNFNNSRFSPQQLAFLIDEYYSAPKL